MSGLRVLIWWHTVPDNAVGIPRGPVLTLFGPVLSFFGPEISDYTEVVWHSSLIALLGV